MSAINRNALAGNERKISLSVDGKVVQVDAGISVAAALLNTGVSRFRESVSGESRAPLCGMGICFDCRVAIDGQQHVRSCLVKVVDGMEVTTG